MQPSIISRFPPPPPIYKIFESLTPMTGAQYHISYCQTLETERRLKLSRILELFSEKPAEDNISLKTSYNHAHQLVTKTLLFLSALKPIILLFKIIPELN